MEENYRELTQIIIAVRGHRENRNLLSYIKNVSYFKNTQAYMENRIYKINAALVCRPGPRAAISLETLANFIHPEIFGLPDNKKQRKWEFITLLILKT